MKIYLFLTECATCSGICWLSKSEIEENTQEVSGAHLLYPNKLWFPKDVPEEIRTKYEEAKKVINISPDAFAVLMRKALEYLCQAQGVKEYNLSKMLSQLSKKGVIPGHLARMTKAIRALLSTSVHMLAQSILAKQRLRSSMTSLWLLSSTYI